MNLNIKKYHFICFLMLFLHIKTHAQKKYETFFGVIYNESETISNVHIINLNNKTGTISNTDGSFNINASIGDVYKSVQEVNGVNYLSHVFENTENEVLRDFIDGFKGKYTQGVVVFGNVIDDKAQVLVGVTKDLMQQVKAGDLIKLILSQVNGRGGGRPDFAQGGGHADKAQLSQVFNATFIELQSRISN